MDKISSGESKAAASQILPFGLFYFTAVFTIAFAMGVARALWIAPRLGSTAAVLLEVPILVVVSWIAARRLLRYKDFTLSQRAASGAIAFTLTLASEAAFASILRAQGVSAWAAAILTPPGLVGLAGQLIFGAMPMFVSRDQAALAHITWPARGRLRLMVNPSCCARGRWPPRRLRLGRIDRLRQQSERVRAWRPRRPEQRRR